MKSWPDLRWGIIRGIGIGCFLWGLIGIQEILHGDYWFEKQGISYWATFTTFVCGGLIVGIILGLIRARIRSRATAILISASIAAVGFVAVVYVYSERALFAFLPWLGIICAAAITGYIAGDGWWDQITEIELQAKLKRS